MNRMTVVVAACLGLSTLAADPPAKAGTRLSRASSCQKRFAALCAVMHRCSTGAEDLGGAGCEAIDPGCNRLQGQASYNREVVDACVAGLEKLICKVRVDPNEAAKLEERVAACQTMTAADEQESASR